MDTTAPAVPAADTPQGIAASYRPRPGVTDEMVGPDGTIRPLWQPLIERLDGLAPHGIDARFARADRYLRDAGVYFRAYGADGSDPREWPLAHVPLVIDEAEWQGIAAGLVQRARLLESVIADIYGGNRLVAEGLLPPQLIAASPEYLRPMAGASGQAHHLHFLAFELGRGLDGRWWVLGDRTQAPSGAGFALENRVATGRAFGDMMTTMNVHRLAGFFRDLRGALFSLANQPDGGVAVLTPGLHNETYFEHAYIARYLGLMLLEGGDLMVSDGKVMVRTIEGPKPLSVLWRRLDSAFTDPLELRRESRIGTPGLVEAVRRGGATMVNAIGSGILETRALLAFLPGISRRLNGEELALPHIATWWCGGEREREHVIGDLDRVMIGPALTTELPFDDNATTVLPATLDATEKAALVERLRAAGEDYVAQESVSLSTMPYYVDGRLEPRPVTLRAFAMRTPSGWTVLPGGFARVGASSDASVVAMQRGGYAADVWIVSRSPVEQLTLLPDGDDTSGVRLPADLPSRAADNLFWLGRYIERADGLARVLRAFHARLAEDPDPRSPVMPAIRSALQQIGIDEDQPIPDALLASIDAANDSAGRIRDRFSPDGWLALKDLSKTTHRFAGVVTAGDDAARAMTVLLRKLAGFAGIAHENMYHGAGWRFLEIGRRLERAMETARLMSLLAAPEQPVEFIDLLVEIGDSVMTQRRLYRVNSGRLAAIELLALDEANPRSILCQLAGIKAQVAELPGDRLNPVWREALRLHTALAISAAKDVTPEVLMKLGTDLAGLSDAVDSVYFR